jgi:hypothetical protein
MPAVETVTGCVGGAPLPAATVNGSVVGFKFSAGQSEVHAATTWPLVTPRVVESPAKVWPESTSGSYVPWLAELTMPVSGNASGIGAGMVPPGKAPVVVNVTPPPALKSQLLFNVSLGPAVETVAEVVHENVYEPLLPMSTNVRGTLRYVWDVGA